MLIGEPGIGKTRLAAEFCRTAYAGGATVLLGRCHEESLVPYQPFVEALSHHVAESPLDELRLQMGPHRATLAKLLPELAEQLANPAMGGAEDSEREQFLLFDAVASLLREAARANPLILVLDDLHWADVPTLQLLRHVARSSEPASLMVLGTYRETEVDDAHPLAQVLAELRRARALDSVRIGGLVEADVAELISAQAAREAPTRGVIRSILERTEGNPFFVEEVLRDVGIDDDWSAALERIGVPDSIKDLLLRRLRRLDDAAAFHDAALGIAAELGDKAAQTLALDRLSVISSHLLELDRGLELGERALQLARETGDPSIVGRAMDSIKLAALQLGDLARLKALTDELEPLWRERSDLWYLQWTLLESAFAPIGAGHWDEAAERLAEAVAINRRVRDPGAEPLILDALCWLHRSRGAYEEALSAGRRAVALGASIGWEGWTAPTLGCLLLELYAPAPAAAVLERGLEVAEENGARQALTRCLGQLAWARWLLGARDEARALADRAEQLLRLVSAPAGGAFLFGTHAYAGIARVHVAAGMPDRGEALLRPVLEAAERSGWRESAAITELALGLCVEARGEHDRAVELLAHAAETADDHGIPAPGREAHRALARMHRKSGQPAEADQQLAIAEAIIERVTAGLTDEALRDGLREQANVPL